MNISKIWGYEQVIVNNEEYCYKKLFIKKGGRGSIHRHLKKKETFIVLEGNCKIATFRQVGKKLVVENVFSAGPGFEITILPKQWHSFQGETYQCVVQEMSTHHSDDDVERFEESSQQPLWWCDGTEAKDFE